MNELLYDMNKSPANEDCHQVLWDMAAICQSTFDVDPPVMHKLLHSARDIEIALSCAILMRMIIPAVIPVKSDHPGTPDWATGHNSPDQDTDSYLRVLLE